MPERISYPVAAGAPLVACLCAAWCRTCGEYRDAFAALAAEFPSLSFVWIDVEDDADGLDALAALDIENFPTLLVADPQRIRFFGTMLPHIGHLRRLLASGDASWRRDADPQAAAVDALAGQLRSFVAA